ncbi:MAG: hypothetical protein ACX930_02215 [Erythrobacter sp.]
MRIVVAALALALTAPAYAGEGAPWRAVDAETGQIRDVEGLEALAEAFPDSSNVRLRLLNAQLGAEDFDGLLATLRWLNERGYVFGEVPQGQIPKLVGEEHAEAARALLLPAPAPIEASEVVATVPAEAGLIEGLFVPDSGEVIIATSITGNSVHLLIQGQDWTSSDIPRANDLSGIVSEPDDSMGWVASANLDGSDDGIDYFTGLIGLTGDNENPVFVPAPEGVAVSDVAISSDATVYASDPLGGGVYRKPVAATELETLVAPGTLRSPQGIAVSEDGARLYVSDYRYGLAMIDVASGEVERLPSDVPAILDGVDGMWRYGNKLIAIQNGTAPMRISAFTLSEDGRRITGVRTLERSHPGWTEPLGGSISNGALYYVATGQWDRFVQGEPAQDKPAIPTEIRRLPLAPPES